MVNAKDSLYKTTCDFLYTKISARAKNAKNILSKKNEDIYVLNPAIASYIVNNKRTNNNPYLVPGRLYTEYGITRNQADVIADNLGFSSVEDFLWGNLTEFHSYSGALFSKLIIDSRSDADSCDKKVIEDALCLYTPYARLSEYNLLLRTDQYKAINFVCDYDEKDEMDILYSAIARLYQRVDKKFAKIYFEFFSGKKTLKLNRTIADFVHTCLIPLVQDYISDDNSFGKSSKVIIESIAQNMANEVTDNLPEDILTEEERVHFETAEEFVNMSLEYFSNLEMLQEKTEGKNNYEMILKDKWSKQYLVLKNVDSKS